MDWKNIGLGALVNAALTTILSFIFLPLSLLGPLVGGFLASYLTKRFEDTGGMEPSDGAVMGAISGIIGGLIIGLLFIAGLGDISALTGLIAGSFIITWYAILQVSIIISLVLGLIGGVLGVLVKN